MKKFLLIASLLSSFQTYAFEKYLCKNTESAMSVEFVLPNQSRSYYESRIVCNGGVGDEPVCSVWSYVREVKEASLKILSNSQAFNFKITVERIKNGIYPDLEEEMHYQGSATLLLDKQYNFNLSSSTGNGDYVLLISPVNEARRILLRCKLATY
jgi:hypothetical protein